MGDKQMQNEIKKKKNVSNRSDQLKINKFTNFV